MPDDKQGTIKFSQYLKQKRWLLILVGIVLLYGVGTAVLYAALRPTATRVQTHTVASSTQVHDLQTTGVITSARQVTLYAPADALIGDVHVQEGDIVEDGQLLIDFDLDDLSRIVRSAEAAATPAVRPQSTPEAAPAPVQSEYRLSLESTQHQLQVATQHAEEISAKYLILAAQVELQVQQRKTDLKELEARYKALDPASLTYEDDELLLNNEILYTRAEIDIIEMPLLSMKNELELAESDVATQQALLKKLEPLANQEAKQNEAAQKAAQKEAAKIPAVQSAQPSASVRLALETARNNLELATDGVVAPMRGVITDMNAQSGAKVDKNASLCVLESLDEVSVSLSLTPQQLEYVRIGQSAVVTALGRRYVATVAKIGSAVLSGEGDTAGTVRVTLSINSPGEGITLGLQADVSVQTGQVQSVLWVPKSAVNTNEQGAYCFVLQNDVAFRRDVVMADEEAERTQILSGLEEGEQIILFSSGLAQGQKVSVDTLPADAKSQ